VPQDHPTLTRRNLLKCAAVALPLVPLAVLPSRAARADAASLPLVTPDDAQAKALKYVPDAKTSKDAKPGSHCGNCVQYQGASGSAQGPCQIFPGKAVKSTGWCSVWAPQM